jgi:hypothetical protein
LKFVYNKTIKRLKNSISEYRINQILLFLVISFLLINVKNFSFQFAFFSEEDISFFLEILIFLVVIVSILLYQRDSLEYNAISPFPATLITYLLVKEGRIETRLNLVIILFLLFYLFLYSVFFSIYLFLFSRIDFEKEKKRNSKYFRILVSFSLLFGPFTRDITEIGFEGIRDIPKIHPVLWTLAAFSSLLAIFKIFYVEKFFLLEYGVFVILISILVIACYRFWSMSPTLWSAVDSIDIWSAVDSTAVIYIDLDQLSLLIWIIGLELYFFESDLMKVVVPIALFFFFLNNILRYRLYSERLVKTYSITFMILLPMVSFLSFILVDRTSLKDWILIFSIPILLSWIIWQYLFTIKKWNLNVQRNLAFISWIIVPMWMMIVICSSLYSYFVFQSGSPPSIPPPYYKANSALSTIVQGLITAIAVIGGFIASGVWYVIHSEKKTWHEHSKYFIFSILALWIVFSSICIKTINSAFSTMNDYCYSNPNLGNEVWYLIKEAQANMFLLVVFVIFSILMYYLSKH